LSMVKVRLETGTALVAVVLTSVPLLQFTIPILPCQPSL
jgi:hypothetical protein